jgi:hypothetical protein
MLINVLLVLVVMAIFASIIIVTKILFARLAVIHALTNSGMGSALTATVVALRSDARGKRELAKLIGGREQLAAADAADEALKAGENLMDKHNQGQGEADAENKTKIFK